MGQPYSKVELPVRSKQLVFERVPSKKIGPRERDPFTFERREMCWVKAPLDKLPSHESRLRLRLRMLARSICNLHMSFGNFPLAKKKTHPKREVTTRCASNLWVFQIGVESGEIAWKSVKDSKQLILWDKEHNIRVRSTNTGFHRCWDRLLIRSKVGAKRPRKTALHL